MIWEFNFFFQQILIKHSELSWVAFGVARELFRPLLNAFQNESQELHADIRIFLFAENRLTSIVVLNLLVELGELTQNCEHLFGIDHAVDDRGFIG